MVVGLSLRAPGIDGPIALWKSLCEGRPPVRCVDPDRPLQTVTQVTHLMAGDSVAMRLPKREIRRMDPQHRLLFEETWRALDDAGLPWDRIRGRRTGVWVGIHSTDFQRMVVQDAQLDGYALLGSTLSFAANRLSHAFDLSGPSVSVSVGCASALVALHQARQSLLLGEVDWALVGAVDVVLTSDTLRMLDAAGVLSAQGRCRTLDAAADGYARAEGAGVLVLTRSTMLEPGDRAYAQLRRTATNHNGRNDWITAVSADAQEHVVRAACGSEEIGYVELHGSALPAGDEAEARAIAAAIGPTRLGAVSNNIGYLGAAGGMAQLAKVCLCLHHGMLTPTIGVDNPNPNIPFEQLGLSIQRALEAWPEGSRRAAILSTSLGGANACAVLEAAAQASHDVAAPPYALLLSGHTPQALRESSARLRAFLADPQHSKVALGDVCYTLARRQHHRHRAAAFAHDRAGLLAALAEPAMHSPSPESELAAWIAGAELPAQLRSLRGRCVSLPAHPFGRERLWFTDDEAVRRPAHRSDDGLRSSVRAAVAEALGLADDALERDERTFFELGLTSLGATGLCRQLEVILQRRVSPTLLFEFPRLDELVAQLEVDAERAPAVAPARAASVPSVAGSSDPIAIVGMACRFPGGVRDPEGFAAQMWSGASAVAPLTPERLALCPDLDPRWHAALVDDVDCFDAAFFRITPREAASMDPQQRFFLELSWEALEDAGIAPPSLRDSRTGVFAGVHALDYARLVEEVDSHHSSGVDASYVASRVSYFLGLKGPAMAVDTACSSSLVAVHQACQSLRCGEAELALAGGVKLLLAPQLTRFLERSDALSRTGRCRAFDAAADGMVQGEGCGVVVLERLEVALQRGHRVLAVLHGTAVNHGGASGGLTVPNAAAQAELYRHALQQAGVQPRDVGFVETHGTGTTLGDPIELSGLSRVYGQDRSPDRPVWLGSSKSIIGHSEAAAGIAGLIKAVAVLQAGQVPAQVGWSTPAKAQWRGLSVPTEPTTLEGLVAVSSFGMSGTNAHVVLGPAPIPPSGKRPAGPHLLALSARDEDALERLIERTIAQLPRLDFADACYTAGVGRAHHAVRRAVVASSATEAIAALRSPRSRRTGAWGELADRYEAGGDVDFAALLSGCQRVRLPTYPWAWSRHWTRPHAPRATLPSFELRWQHCPPAAPAPEQWTGSWQVVAPSAAHVEALEHCIRALGGRLGSHPQPTAAAGQPHTTILWMQPSLDDVAAGCAELAAWVAQRVSHGSAQDDRLIVVTRGASDGQQPAGSVLWGMVRSLAYEHPRLRARLIDLDADPRFDVREQADQIARELPQKDDQVALRGDRRLLPAVQRCALPQGRAARIPTDRTVIITGGLGGLGLRLAAWLARHGAEDIVLMGRTDRSAECAAELAAIAARVRFRRADVANAAELDSALTGLDVGAVFHAAGVLDDGALVRLDQSRLERVLAPKVRGAWNLHRRCPNPEHFVLFSSTAGLLGSPGQAAYAAGNAFLDALAQHRRAQGLAALSIAWGNWAEVGMAAGEDARHADRGMTAMQVDDALRALGAAMAQDAPCVAIADWDPLRWCEAHPAVAGSVLFRALGVPAAVVKPADGKAMLERIRTLDSHARHSRLRQWLIACTSEVSQIPPEELACEASFGQLGFDSMLGLELQDRLARDLDVTVPLSDVMEDSSIDRLLSTLLLKLTVADVAAPVAGKTERVLL